ncbi:MAG: LETM1 domain-containing protein, partial [Bacteroidota bacterium]|nr:LETM1 domain-containing protein [Bacteroidota bacterium]
WSDLKIDKCKKAFFKDFEIDFKVSNTAIKNANNDVNNFYKKYKNEISLLSTQNIAERFFQRASSIVKKLISRNSKRLYQELKESKDLVKLVSESTVRDLNKEEQQQMQEQMMDLIKSIPSLAIFMLPGGAILLPIFIKFIPKLLPSAFDENRIEND